MQKDKHVHTHTKVSEGRNAKRGARTFEVGGTVCSCKGVVKRMGNWEMIVCLKQVSSHCDIDKHILDGIFS